MNRSHLSVFLFSAGIVILDLVPAPAAIVVAGASLAGPTLADLASVAIVVSLLALLSLSRDIAAALRRLTRGETAHV